MEWKIQPVILIFSYIKHTCMMGKEQTISVPLARKSLFPAEKVNQ
jgi:hypothetical protein